MLPSIEGLGGAGEVLQVDCQVRIELRHILRIHLQALLVLEVHMRPLKRPLKRLTTP